MSRIGGVSSAMRPATTLAQVVHERERAKESMRAPGWSAGCASRRARAMIARSSIRVPKRQVQPHCTTATSAGTWGPVAHARSRLAHVACMRFNSYSARWAKSKKGEG